MKMTTGFIGGKFLPLHLGHVNAIIQASNLCDKLYLILSHSKIRDKLLCEKGNIKYIPFEIRLSWLRILAKKLPNAKVIHVEDFYESDNSYNWEEGAIKIKKLIGEKIDFIFSSENSYSEIFEKLYPDSKHIVIDNERSFYNISATKIRAEGVFKN